MKAMTLEERLARARTGFLMGEYDLAEKLLEKIILEKPYLPQVYNILGSIYERKKKYKEAIETFNKVIELNPDNSEAYNNLGVAYKNAGDMEKAQTILKKALRVARNKVDIYYNLGNLFRDKEEYPEAIDYYKKALELNPSYILAYNNLGTVLEKLERDDEAIKIYLRGLQIDVNHPRLHYNLGVIYKEKGRYQQAKDEFEYALRISHGWTLAMNNLGVIYQELGELERALNIFQDILKSEPNNAEVHNNIGVLCNKQKRFDDAVLSFKKAIQLQPQYSRAHFNLALLYAEHGYHNEALEELAKIKTLEPQDVEIAYQEGAIFMLLGRYEDAEKCFKSVIQKNPSHQDSLKALTNVYLKQGKIAEGYAIQKQLEKHGYKNWDFHLDLAFIWKERGELKKAESEVKLYLENNPQDQKAEILLADLCFKQGNLKYAEKILGRLIKSSHPDENAYYLLARVYRGLGDHKRAVAVLKDIIERQGLSDEAGEVDKLIESLKLYEDTINEYEREFDEQWQKNLIKYRDLSADFEKKQVAEEDAFLLDGQGLSDEESVPIIKVGGMEPVLAVREEEEEITLEEKDEILPHLPERRIIEIKEEQAPPLSHLLEGQELRESSAVPRMQMPYPYAGGYQAPSREEPASEKEDRRKARRRKERQAKNDRSDEGSEEIKEELKGIKDELKIAVDAASRALQQSLNSMQGDTRPQVAMPPFSPQYIAVPQIPFPVEITYKDIRPENTAPDKPGTMPYLDQGDEEQDLAVVEQVENAEEQAGASQEEPEVELLEHPESVIADEEDFDSLNVLQDEETSSIEPGTDNLPGDEEAVVMEEKADLFEAGEKSAEATGEKRSIPFPQKNTRQKEQIPNKPPGKLLDYLANIANYLPQDRQFNVLENEMHLKMQYVRAKIAGNRGLMNKMNKIKERVKRDFSPAAAELTTNSITSTFSFMKNLSSFIPNKEMGNVIASKIDSILEKMGSA